MVNATLAPPMAGRRNRISPLPDSLSGPGLRGLIRHALREDLGPGDITSRALVAPGRVITAVVVARHACIVCGAAIAAHVFRELDPGARVRVLVPDGCRARRDKRLMQITGKARAILAGERTALNFLQRLTGIATLTARFVEQVQPHRTRILDTRKTTPVWRMLEKYAVRCGGGANHRMGLYDQVLIKDNHRRLWGARDLGMAVHTARRRCPGVPVEVEVETEAELECALAARPDWILLDNMTPKRLRRCVHLCRGRCSLEASGGITLANVKAVAAAGVQAISLGCLTHSAPAADLSLEILDANP
ncbi:MAG: carboxylating nicotinate-nucleotide diphosphorylase [Kiritimatiellae bacterium]|nr:carboxylating nicotinate-nucleotide diphosphorylase [Kiritimatiellia bacterium]